MYTPSAGAMLSMTSHVKVGRRNNMYKLIDIDAHGKDPVDFYTGTSFGNILTWMSDGVGVDPKRELYGFGRHIRNTHEDLVSLCII